MSSTSSSFDFEKTVRRLLQEYRGEVFEALTEVVPQVGREAAKKLRAESPRSNTRRSGTYAKGWSFKQEKGRLKVLARVYGKSGTYQLAHLLEKGHAKRGGGRTGSYPHIAPVEQWANDELENKVIAKLSGGKA